MTLFLTAAADSCADCLDAGLVVCTACDGDETPCSVCEGRRNLHCPCAAGQQLQRRWAPLRTALAASDPAALAAFVERVVQRARRDASALLLELAARDPAPLRRHLARRRHPPAPATWRRTARALANDASDEQALLELGWALGDQLTCMLDVARLPAVEAQPLALRSALTVALGLRAARGAIALVVAFLRADDVHARASPFATSLVTMAGAAHACRRLATVDDADLRTRLAAATMAGEDAALAWLTAELAADPPTQ